MNFSNLIDKNLIVLDLDSLNKNEVIEKLVDLLDENGALINKNEFLEAVLLRETKSPTG